MSRKVWSLALVGILVTSIFAVATTFNPAMGATGTGKRSISFSASIDKGEIFGAAFELSESRHLVLPNIAVSDFDSKTWYVVWHDDRDIFFAANTYKSNSLGTVHKLTNSAKNPALPQIAAAGDNVYVVWHDDGKIFYTSSTDRGATFGEVVSRTNDLAQRPVLPQIAAAGDNVYVVWQDGSDIFFTATADRGATFGEVQKLSSGNAFNPKIVAAGENVYVVWQDFTPGKRDILLRSSNDRGATFGEVVNLSNSLGHPVMPQIAAAGENVYVVWQDFTPGKRDILLRSSNDRGATFGEVVNLSDNLADSINPKIAAAGENVYVVWHDFASGRPDVLYRSSNDNGSTFGTIMNLSTNDGISINPQIVAAGENVYVVWHDFTLGKRDILLRSSNDRGATFGASVNLSKGQVNIQTSAPLPVEQPVNLLEVSAEKGGSTIKSYSDTIVITNNGDLPIENVRIVLSPEIDNSFYLEQHSISSIGPKESVSIGFNLIGKPNQNAYGGVDAYNGQIQVSSANLKAVTLPVKIGPGSSSHFDAYMQNITAIAQQRYTRTVPAGVLVDAILSANRDNVEQTFEVTGSDGKRVITSSSDQLTIKNNSDEPLNNVRIFLSSSGHLFLLDKRTIESIPANGEAVIQMTSRITDHNAHEEFSGEVIVAPVNGNPIVIPVNIPSNFQEKKDLEISVLSGSAAVTSINKMADYKIVIKNIGERDIGSVRIMLPNKLGMLFDLSNDAFQTIPAGGEVTVDMKFKAFGPSSFTRSVTGELLVVSANDDEKLVVPVDVVWNKVSSNHFAIYSKSDPKEVSKATALNRFLESQYQAVTEKFGVLRSQTVIYLLSSSEEFAKIAPDSAIPYYYSYDSDISFVTTDSSTFNEDALRLFVYRTMMQTNPSYWNKEKFVFDEGNWLADGIANYVALRMTGQKSASGASSGIPAQIKKDVDSFLANPVELEWYGKPDDRQYAATYTFFKYLEDTYGSKTIDKIIWYLGTGMISNHRCNTLENCVVLLSVYDASGLTLSNTRNKMDVKTLVEDWKEQLLLEYNVWNDSEDTKNFYKDILD